MNDVELLQSIDSTLKAILNVLNRCHTCEGHGSVWARDEKGKMDWVDCPSCEGMGQRQIRTYSHGD